MIISENLSALNILHDCLLHPGTSTSHVMANQPATGTNKNANTVEQFTGSNITDAEVIVNLKEDNQIASLAMNTCKQQWKVPDDKVTASVKNGWLTLAGELEWPYQSEAAANAVKNIQGVKGVLNHITIKKRMPDTADVRIL